MEPKKPGEACQNGYCSPKRKKVVFLLPPSNLCLNPKNGTTPYVLIVSGACVKPGSLQHARPEILNPAPFQLSLSAQAMNLETPNLGGSLGTWNYCWG